MIGFAHPELLTLLPVPVILAVLWPRRRRPALRYSDLRLMDGIPPGVRVIWANWGGAILRGLVGVLFVLAAANPRTPDLRTRIPTEGIAIILALDVSGSMATTDFGSTNGPAISRLDAAKRSFRLFVEGGTNEEGSTFPGRPTDQIGLVTFAAVPRTACPLTLNHTVLLHVLTDQEPRSGVDAGTNVGDAIAEGLIRLEACGNQKKVLILLSDGEHNVGSSPNGPLTPRQSAQLAANLSIPIYTIDCGGDPSRADSPEQRLAGREVLAAVATMTGGRSFTADNLDELEAVYHEIDKLNRETIIAYRYRRYHEYGRWCGLSGVVVLALLGVLERTIWRRFP